MRSDLRKTESDALHISLVALTVSEMSVAFDWPFMMLIVMPLDSISPVTLATVLFY